MRRQQLLPWQRLQTQRTCHVRSVLLQLVDSPHLSSTRCRAEAAAVWKVLAKQLAETQQLVAARLLAAALMQATLSSRHLLTCPFLQRSELWDLPAS